MKCCQDPGQEQSFVKEMKNLKKKQAMEKHDVKPMKSKYPLCLASHTLFHTGCLQSSLSQLTQGPAAEESLLKPVPVVVCATVFFLSPSDNQEQIVSTTHLFVP